MWKYIVIWTLVTVTQNPCPDETGKCKMRHQSYNYKKKQEKDLTRDEAISLFDYLKRTEAKFTDYHETVTDIKIDSVFVIK